MYEIGDTIKAKSFNTNKGVFICSINFDSLLKSSYFCVSFKQPIDSCKLDMRYEICHYSNCYTARALLIERKTCTK